LIFGTWILAQSTDLVSVVIWINRLPRSHDQSAGKKGDRMSQVVIESPIINSPFDEPVRHFRFSDEGIANEIDGTANQFVFRPPPG
jgi:hypothetical protein